jgi:transcriptional regulator with XRE-family HTH domain
MDRDALAEFLVRHREALQPADVGLSAGPRRRAPGLRREEVAQLAAMSTDYYARLEQRRGPQPSTQMLSSLARALRLSPDERDYLYRVAGHSAPDRSGASEGYVAPGLLRVMDRLTDTPAFIISALDEVLVQNDPARALFGDASAWTGMERSGIYRWFVHPEARRVYPSHDHARQSRAAVASLRAAYGVMGAQSRAGELARELSRVSPEFAELWASQVVARRFEDHKTVVHPELGPIEVDCQALFTEDGSQTLVVLTAPPHSEAESTLKLLAVLGTQQFSA